MDIYICLSVEYIYIYIYTYIYVYMYVYIYIYILELTCAFHAQSFVDLACVNLVA